MIAKLTRWLFFSVVIAILPIIFNLIRSLTHGESVTLQFLLGRGELLLVTAGISAKAVGELIGSSPSMKVPKIIVGGISVIVLLLASWYFADVAASYAGNQKMDENIIANMSLILLFSAVVSGAGCVALAEVK